MSRLLTRMWFFPAVLALAGTAAMVVHAENARSTRRCGKSCPDKRKSEKEREIEQKLKTTATIDFANTPLKQVIEDLRTFHGLNIWVDDVALQQEGINLDELVTLKLENVSLRSVLTLLLRSHRLTYVIKDEVVEITTEKEAHGKLVTACYLVGDLITPPVAWSRLGTSGSTTATAVASPVEPLMGMWGGGPVGAPAPVYNANGNGCGNGGYPTAVSSEPKRLAPALPTEERTLIDLIKQTVCPNSWSDTGGDGTIEYFPLTMSLVVNQTADVQEQIQDLVQALRRLQEQVVRLEVTVVSVSKEMAGRLKKQYGVDCARSVKLQGETGPQVTQVGEKETERFLTLLGSDRQTQVEMSPTLLLVNGQTGCVQLPEASESCRAIDVQVRNGRFYTEESRPGMSLYTQTAIAADRRTVRVDLDLKTVLQDRPWDNWKAKHLLTIPANGTAVLSGWKIAGKQKPANWTSECSPADCPVEDTTQTRYQLVLITPNLVSEEKDLYQEGYKESAPVAPKVVEETVREKLVTAAYQVADLVIPIPDFGQLGSGAAPAVPPPPPPLPPNPQSSETVRRTPSGTCEQSLIDLITREVAPVTWSQLGGLGRISYFPLSMSLVVTQTREVHQQIENLLRALRREQDQEVALQFSIWCIGEKTAARLKESYGIDCQRGSKLDGSSQPQVTILDSSERKKMAQLGQGDRATNVCQLPKLTAFNGQSATFRLEGMTLFDQVLPGLVRTGDDAIQCAFQGPASGSSGCSPPGVYLTAQGILRGELKSIRVNVDFKASARVGPGRAAKLLPSGRSSRP